MDPYWIQQAIDNVPFGPGDYPTNPKVKTPRQAYRNHIDQLAKATKQAVACGVILQIQERLGMCKCPNDKTLQDFLEKALEDARRHLRRIPPVPVMPAPEIEWWPPVGPPDPGMKDATFDFLAAYLALRGALLGVALPEPQPGECPCPASEEDDFPIPEPSPAY
jgi:hypothetical protein